MTHRYGSITVSFVLLLPGCQCENPEVRATDVDMSSSGSLTGSSSSTGESTGTPFDASRWIGRYHYEDAWLEFGERGTPISELMLANFEIRADATATMFYESCGEGPPIVIAYRWEPGEVGSLHLYPGEGESRLRFMADAVPLSPGDSAHEPCMTFGKDHLTATEAWVDASVKIWAEAIAGE
jgi:hypothetical protein